MLPLAPHIHLAALGDDVVLLDVLTDAYLCIPGGVAHLRPDSGGAHVDPPDDDIRRMLAEAGYLTEGDAGPARARPDPPRRSLEARADARPARGEALRLAAATLDLLTCYRGRSLAQILAVAARRQPSTSDPLEAVRLAQVFQHFAPWLPLSRKCLVRSFVLLRFLQRSGVAAQWVFGVRTWPFSAHCWIQHGDLVLDDHWERLVVYEPILRVG